MSLSKIVIAGVFTITSFFAATASFAQDNVVCLDGSVENGDCIAIGDEPSREELVNAAAGRDEDRESDDD